VRHWTLTAATLCGALLISSAPLGAQRGGLRPAPPAEPGSTLRISVLTFGPGDAVWERFGHNAIRVLDTATGSDLAYNWGMFSFDDPNFIPRFLSGETEYWVDTFQTPALLDYYRRNDRESLEQVLALTPAQRAEIAAFVTANIRPENRHYRYDYFLDNCSTRVRDVLDRVLGGALERRFTVLTTSLTYRSETVRLLTPDVFPQAGTDFALGPRADQPLTVWASMFVPMRFRDALRDVTVEAPGGGTRPLVSSEIVHHDAARASEPAEARGIALGMWGPLLGAWMLLLVPLSERSRRRTRIPAAVMATLWYGVTGFLGLVLLGMWLGSAHRFWYENLNLLIVSPLGLVAAVPAAMAVARGRAAPWLRWLLIAIVAQAVLALLLAPFVTQRLGGPLLLVLPAHLGLAAALWRHLRAASAASPVSPA
jgi:hypothetical protein